MNCKSQEACLTQTGPFVKSICPRLLLLGRDIIVYISRLLSNLFERALASALRTYSKLLPGPDSKETLSSFSVKVDCFYLKPEMFPQLMPAV